MRLKVLDAIEAEQTGRVFAPMRRARALFEAMNASPGLAVCRDMEWRTELRLTIRQRGPEGEREEVLQYGRRMIAAELFGEIEAEVRLALESLWEDGVTDSPANERLERLLVLLRGADAPDPAPTGRTYEREDDYERG